MKISCNETALSVAKVLYHAAADGSETASDIFMEKTLKQRFLHRCTGALIVALAVFVLLTCWVLFTQQKAGAVTGGKYDVKFVVYDTNDGCNGEKGRYFLTNLYFLYIIIL